MTAHGHRTLAPALNPYLQSARNSLSMEGGVPEHSMAERPMAADRARAGPVPAVPAGPDLHSPIRAAGLQAKPPPSPVWVIPKACPFSGAWKTRIQILPQPLASWPRL